MHGPGGGVDPPEQKQKQCKGFTPRIRGPAPANSGSARPPESQQRRRTDIPQTAPYRLSTSCKGPGCATRETGATPGRAVLKVRPPFCHPLPGVTTLGSCWLTGRAPSSATSRPSASARVATARHRVRIRDCRSCSGS